LELSGLELGIEVAGIAGADGAGLGFLAAFFGAAFFLGAAFFAAFFLGAAFFFAAAFFLGAVHSEIGFAV